MNAQPKMLELAFNHIVFPPRLPGRQDSQVEDVERDLVSRLLDAAKVLKDCSMGDDLTAWHSIEESLETCKIVNDNGHINRVALLDALNQLQPYHAIILRVTEQNAGLIIRRAGLTEDVIFEAFEASPAAEQTLAAKGALKWDFPGIAVSLPLSEFYNPVFQDNLTSFLEKASLELVDEFAAKSYKAGATITENRDTTSPALITQFLATVLEVNGSRVYPPVLRKRIKDDVCWDDAELPWRRSPYWLILRVSVQRMLYLRLGEKRGRIQYKFLLCYLMAHLLANSVHVLSSELCDFLKTKLCRRLAKLESERMIDGPALAQTYTHLFVTIGSVCQKSIDSATAAIENQWNSFKQKTRRQIPTLPLRAENQDLELTLPNSSAYLAEVLRHPNHQKAKKAKVDPSTLGSNASKSTTEQFESLSTRYSALADKEMSIEFTTREIPKTKLECEDRCKIVAPRITNHLVGVGVAYDGDPENMSIFILDIFEMWMELDKCATVVYPLLREYHPCFDPEILDVLLLPRLHHMHRLQKIQSYLHERCTAAKTKMTIFSDPEQGCFADRYFDFDSADNMQRLYQLQKRIDAASTKTRNAKEKELENVNAKHKELSQSIAQTACTQRRNPDGTHDIRGCDRCFHLRSRRRLKIQVHEDFLPLENRVKCVVQKRAIVFELDTPASFLAYRETTWEIINTLCSKIPSSENAPNMLLGNYSQLKNFDTRRSRRLSLASNAKSYLDTHYNWKRLPAKAANILLPLGLNFSYYDSERSIWAKDVPQQLTFAHHFALKLPRGLSFADLYSSPAFAADSDGPSSYEVISSITKCPPDLSVHEFKAHQNLVAGKNRRWISILTELGSSNINFSLQDTMVLFHHLALQAGPRLENDHLRAVHVVFKDEQFCQRLIEQIEQHSEAISANWRESYYMETLLTLTIRICDLGCPETSTQAYQALVKIRQITLNWIRLLRNETRTTQEADVAERAARYGFMSALLCRRTFAPHAYNDTDLDTESFRAFIEATLAMQENLVVDLSKFSATTHNMLVRDIKMTFRIRTMLRKLVKRYPSSLESAMETVWADADSASRTYTQWKFLSSPYDWWVTSTVEATRDTVAQTVHYHILEGHLLVDGRALGKLPADIRDSEILKGLFGNQRLLAFPSPLQGMSYVLGIQKDGHEIHIGYRKEQLIIRARTRTALLEFIPSSIFVNGSNFDLPGSLIYDCVHWVDLRTGILEARQQPHIWRSRPGNWSINTSTRRARRNQGSALVDPNSRTFSLVAQIFRHFEQPHKLTLYQPVSNNLSVELRHMNLIFQVNKLGNLRCRQLGAEIDSNQDAGTLYGLQSMLVLRDGPQRSVITPLGGMRYQRHGVHVLVQIENNGSYAKYTIDDVLGRLHCPPEPRLLYNKALLHAFTSFVLPDPLTGRTGTEEALHCLQSGYCQPWCPLIPQLVDMLQALAKLTPQRRYYPKELRRQQVVRWDPHLTTTIQHDAYQVVVDWIIKKSKRLSLFQTDQKKATVVEEFPETPHLLERALWRRLIYERPDILVKDLSPPSDLTYIARDSRTMSSRTANVWEIVSLLRQRPQSVCTTPKLRNILKLFPVIGGYVKEFSPFDITEYLCTDLAQEWGGLVNLCRDCAPNDVYKLMFQLGMVTFGSKVDMTLVRTIAAFFVLDALKGLSFFPLYSTFTGLGTNEKPSSEALLGNVRFCCKKYQSPAISKKKMNKMSQEDWDRIMSGKERYEEDCQEESEEFTKFLLAQWPTADPSVEGFKAKCVDVDQALEAILPLWEESYGNLKFSSHINQVQAILDRHSTKTRISVPELIIPKIEVFCLHGSHKSLIPELARDLLGKPGPKIGVESANPAGSEQPILHRAQQWARRSISASWQSMFKDERISTPEISELEAITNKLIRSDCSVRSTYGQDLMQSINALKMVKTTAEEKPQENISFNEEINKARDLVRQYHSQICSALAKDDTRFSWLTRSNLWPCVTPTAILEQLRSTSEPVFGQDMKPAFMEYAKAIVHLQRLFRMKDAYMKGDEGRLKQERDNPGHVNWDTNAYPDWLLLEIDANMQIREDQVTVAMEMIRPTSDENSVLQMNMGQGKTSVIMPMVACVLANGDILNRLLVPKALLSQTAQILQSRLGGLLGREITHIPFSRRTQTTLEHIQEYFRLHDEMRQGSGVILGIPEHVLSFKLCGLQRVSDSRVAEAAVMVATQRWLDKACRDILDECDFTLAAKTQLIYPSGSQLAVDGHPHRWEVAQVILSLVAFHVRELAREYPQSIDVVERTASGFPVIYLLRKDVEEALTKRIMDDICYDRTSILPIRQFSEWQHAMLRFFFSQENVNQIATQNIMRLFPDSPKAKKNLYLLRGLLVNGILLLCLKKRWNVQYGLDPRRDPVAVPFHAKGVPSEQAEWGHPDVAILFTCLAFYYEGLNQKQLRQSLQAVLKSDDPATEYDRWTQASATLPEALRHWNIINVDDDGQVAEIWNHLRFATVVINHFLNNFVFPVHAKQFSIKLQASGWDVPLFSLDKATVGVKRPGLTTGFSGTNDNRRLLPLTIQQRDLPGLSHTNAEVLTYLLQKRSRHYMLASKDGRRLSELDLLRNLKWNEIRILIDAGAFILEMDNKSLVKAWLQQDNEAQAGVYFGADNKPWVLYRHGRDVPLIATPFADDLSKCVVYLDEAHTRGTDLKFPAYARGAVTLGLNQTKDHTVQAAMRLRQLGTTQSITFVAPPEVHQSILDVCQKGRQYRIDSSHVITWLMDQTCNNNKELQPLYFAQGRDFCQRRQAEFNYRNFLTVSSQRLAYMRVLQQPEQQDLEELYGPKSSKSNSWVGDVGLSGKLYLFQRELRERQQDSSLISAFSNLALEEVEQEREVAFEIEQEREVQRPEHMKPLTFAALSRAIRRFITTGVLSGESGYMRASAALQSTQLGQKYGIDASSLLQHLYVSTEFTRTVKVKNGQTMDNYTRPVNWVLWSRKSETGLVVIPEEAELLIPIIRSVGDSMVHLFTYAAPVTRKMLHFNRLDYHAIPSFPVDWSPPAWLSFELGILAGRLYFEFSEYHPLLDRILGVGNGGVKSNTDRNMLDFLGEWLSLRRQGQDITHTPMGYVCQGWQLRSDHPFFARRVLDMDAAGQILNQASYSPPEPVDEFDGEEELEDDEE